METSLTRTILSSNARSGIWIPKSQCSLQYKSTSKTLRAITILKLLTALNLKGREKLRFTTLTSSAIENFFGMEVDSLTLQEFFLKACELHLQKRQKRVITLEKVSISLTWLANLRHTVDLSSQIRQLLLSSVKLLVVTADSLSVLTMMQIICHKVSTAPMLLEHSAQSHHRQSIWVILKYLLERLKTIIQEDGWEQMSLQSIRRTKSR